MATKKIKGVVIPRHDTAINWAKATTFIPSDGELIVFSSDSQSVVNAGYDVSSTTATNLDGSTGTFIPEPSAKTRFKFGNGKTNVNLLPFVETGSSENGADVDLSNYYNKDETKAAIIEELNKYDSVALMEVTKSDTGVLELNDVYAIQNNANITVENKNVTYSFYSKNFVDTKCCLKDWVENFYDTNYETSEEFRSCTLSEYPIEMIVQFTEDNGDSAGYGYSTDLTGTSIFMGSFTALANNASINFGDGNYNPGYNHIDVHNLQVNATYKLIVQVEEIYDESSKRYYNRIPRVYLLQLANNEDDSVLYISGVEPDASGNIDSSLMMSPTTIIVPNSLDAFNNLITATYDTEYKVDQHYNKDSAIPQSGTAVEDALNSLVTVMKGSSIDDITAAGVTSKVVILYEE